MEQINTLFENLLNIGMGVGAGVAAFFVMGAPSSVCPPPAARSTWSAASPPSSRPSSASPSCRWHAQSRG